MRRSSLFLSAWVLAASALAQAEEKIAVRTFLLGTTAVEGAFLQTGSESKPEFTPLRFPTRQFSETVQASAQNPLPIFRAGSASNSEEPSYSKLRTVQLPPGAKRVFLFGWRDKDSFSFRAIPDDLATSGPGTWLLINTTKIPVAFQIGEDSKPKTIQPGKTESYRVSVTKETGLAAKGMIKKKGVAKAFYSTYWPVQKDKRNIILFLPKGDGVAVKKIIDQESKSD